MTNEHETASTEGEAESLFWRMHWAEHDACNHAGREGWQDAADAYYDAEDKYVDVLAKSGLPVVDTKWW